MSLRRSVSIAAVSLALLAGCSHDKPESSDVAAAPTTQPGTTAGTTGPALPDPSGTAVAVPTATGATTATAGAPVNPAATTATIRPRIAATPSRPANLPTPDIGALQNAWITATVTRGGSGPCYTLTSSDGVAWATWSAQGIRLANGAKVRARITPGATPVNCGTGRPAKLERLQLAG